MFTAYCHLCLLREIECLSCFATASPNKCEKCTAAQSHNVCITEKIPSITLSDESTIPIRSIPGQIFRVDQCIDVAGLIILIHNGVDSNMTLRDIRIIEYVLTSL